MPLHPLVKEQEREIYALNANASPYCGWEYDAEDSGWHTDCDEVFVFMDDGPNENHYNFCPNCGRQIAIAAAQDEAEEP